MPKKSTVAKKKTNKKARPTKSIKKSPVRLKISFKKKHRKKVQKLIAKCLQPDPTSSDSSSEEVSIRIPKRQKKLFKEDTLYVFKNDRFQKVSLGRPESSSSEVSDVESSPSAPPRRTTRRRPAFKKKNPKIRESRIRRQSNAGRLQEQRRQQRLRFQQAQYATTRLCLVDYWEDSNNRADKACNLRAGRIWDSRAVRPESLRFELQSELGMRFRVEVDEDLFMACSCADWRDSCRPLGIMCQHLCYVVRFVLKYPEHRVEDNRFQDKLAFFQRLQNIKVDYNDERVFEGVGNALCPLCYKSPPTASHSYSHSRATGRIACPDCRNVFHYGCAKLWFSKSRKKICVYCGSGRLKNVF